MRATTTAARRAARDLVAACRSFGPSARDGKVRLLGILAGEPGLPRTRGLAEALAFLRAYPDSPQVLGLVTELARRVPDVDVVHPFSLPVVRELVRLLPGRVRVAWDAGGDETRVQETLMQSALLGESMGLEDIYLSQAAWFRLADPGGERTDLEILLGLLDQAGVEAGFRTLLYDGLGLSVEVALRHPADQAVRPQRVHYQRKPVSRRRGSLVPTIRRPLPAARRGGRAELDLAHRALAVRGLEIYPLSRADPDDVLVVAGGRGLEIVLAGVGVPWRSALESLFFFLVLKNGVPVGYGPAAVFRGCCEMGINLFPEFRGGEIREVYAQFMRTLHHHLGVEYFYLTAYGMGEGNEDAIRTGAFWFYRKLGFVPTNPDVEALAREEEARMAADPGHRSDRRMLRRLATTDAALDLSGGRYAPFPLGALGIALTRAVEEAHDGDREAMLRSSIRRVGRLLDLPRSTVGLRITAPVLALVPDLAAWSRRDLGLLRRIVLAKGARSAREAALLLKRHDRLAAALSEVAAGVPD